MVAHVPARCAGLLNHALSGLLFEYFPYVEITLNKLVIMETGL